MAVIALSVAHNLKLAAKDSEAEQDGGSTLDALPVSVDTTPYRVVMIAGQAIDGLHSPPI
ncbi:MAG TPA: hypothetical protein VGF11_05480 [Acidimicrobiales bacterium]